MTRLQAASKGGQAVLAKYGREHFIELAHIWWNKYTLKPFGGNDFLIVNRMTGAINARTLNGACYSANDK